jgi:hypothetical protein
MSGTRKRRDSLPIPLPPTIYHLGSIVALLGSLPSPRGSNSARPAPSPRSGSLIPWGWPWSVCLLIPKAVDFAAPSIVHDVLRGAACDTASHNHAGLGVAS